MFLLFRCYSRDRLLCVRGSRAGFCVVLTFNWTEGSSNLMHTHSACSLVQVEVSIIPLDSSYLDYKHFPDVFKPSKFRMPKIVPQIWKICHLFLFYWPHCSRMECLQCQMRQHDLYLRRERIGAFSQIFMFLFQVEAEYKEAQETALPEDDEDL